MTARLIATTVDHCETREENTSARMVRDSRNEIETKSPGERREMSFRNFIEGARR
jgi:hypothetical protein